MEIQTCQLFARWVRIVIRPVVGGLFPQRLTMENNKRPDADMISRTMIVVRNEKSPLFMLFIRFQ